MSLTNILVFGQTGQVATELGRMDERVTTLGRHDADLTDPAACAATIMARKPDAVINAAGYTAVDRAEEDEATADLVNAKAPAAMAQACASLGIPFLTISTDYVFQGNGTAPWAPNDTTDPLGAYGRTKRDGENAVAKAGGDWAILRTSWVFSAHGNNFVKTMLRLGGERYALTVVGDQIGGPTAAADIARACLIMIDVLAENPKAAGIYHFASGPDTSWASFAREIFNQAEIACDVTDIPTADYPTPAQRPLNSRLDCSATLHVFGIERPDWRISLKDVLSDLKS